MVAELRDQEGVGISILFGEKIVKLAHSATAIGLIQVIFIVGGFVITAGIMKANGYPDIGKPFPPPAEFVRHNLPLLLLFPLVWTVLACLDYSKWDLPSFGLPIHFYTGIAAILLILILMARAIVSAWYGPKYPIGPDPFDVY